MSAGSSKVTISVESSFLHRIRSGDDDASYIHIAFIETSHRVNFLRDKWKAIALLRICIIFGTLFCTQKNIIGGGGKWSVESLRIWHTAIDTLIRYWILIDWRKRWQPCLAKAGRTRTCASMRAIKRHCCFSVYLYCERWSLIVDCRWLWRRHHQSPNLIDQVIQTALFSC